MEPPRSRQERKQDTLGRLESDADAWIATADTAGNAYLLPLSRCVTGPGWAEPAVTVSPAVAQ